MELFLNGDRFNGYYEEDTDIRRCSAELCKELRELNFNYSKTCAPNHIYTIDCSVSTHTLRQDFWVPEPFVVDGHPAHSFYHAMALAVLEWEGFNRRHPAFQAALKKCDPMKLERIVNEACNHFHASRGINAEAFYETGKAVVVAYRIARALVRSNNQVFRALRSTGNKYIIATGRDFYWQSGEEAPASHHHPNNTFLGANWWGLALMAVRSDIFAQFRPPFHRRPGACIRGRPM
jgi:predicted NAD-dependent protein-ADP-ribosyltransferase YbiA (DUF1768 family)